MVQNLSLFNIMPGLTESDDSGVDSMPWRESMPMPSLTAASDLGLDDSMVSLMGDDDEDHDTPDLTDSQENESEAEDMKRNIEIVMARATVTHNAALEALIKCNRDILDAINDLCPDRDPSMPLLTVSDVSTDISDAEDDEYDLTSEDELEDDESNSQK